MPGTTDRPRDARSQGVFEHVAGFSSAFADYLRLRLVLAGMEAKDAAINYAIVAALGIGALVVIVFGWLFFCIALVFAIAALIPGEHPWIWVMFGMALLHFAAAIVAGVLARSKIGTPVFTDTLNEFKKDQQWLTPTTARQV